MKKQKRQNPTFDPKRAFSWSAISLFQWNKDMWWRKYVGGELPEVTPELAFGSYVDKKIQDDPKFLPKLERYPIMQHKMQVEFNGIPLIGIADHFDRDRLRLKDDKTGRKKWDKKRADDTGQLSMYALMLWLTEKIRPEDMEFRIDWLPTHIKDGEICFIEPDHKKLVPEVFYTKRTMRQTLAFGQTIMDTYAEMLEYCKHRPILDTDSWEEWNA